MDTKTILVTGATDGIGEKTALELARQGHTLLLHGRDKEKGARVLGKINKETCNGNLSFYLADYSSLEEVKEMAEAVQREHKRLDVLVNNAGGFFRERQINADGLEMTITVNHLAPVLLTMLLLDTIKAGAPSRIVTIASTAHRNIHSVDFEDLHGEKTYSGFDAYALSKLGNVLFSNALARRLAGSGVVSNALHPGVIDTKLLRMSWNMSGASVAEGARTSIYLASDPGADEVSGRYFSNMREQAPSDLAQDEDLQERFWTVTMDLLADYLD